jgi:hypothetical protein
MVQLVCSPGAARAGPTRPCGASRGGVGRAARRGASSALASARGVAGRWRVRDPGARVLRGRLVRACSSCVRPDPTSITARDDGRGLEVVGGGLDAVSDPKARVRTSKSGTSMLEIERSRCRRDVGGPQNVRRRTPRPAPDPCPCPPDPLPSSRAVIEVCSSRSELEHCGASARRGPRLREVCSGRSELERSPAPSGDAGPGARPELGRVGARARRRRAGRAAG